jgi:hypothetical protein
VWLASDPSRDSNWGVDVSFVLFCGELLDRMYPAASTGEAGVVEWTERRAAAPAPASVRSYSCVPAVGSLVIGLLLLATLLLLRRGRMVAG